MDSKQFDDLVARLARGTSRREALKGVAGGALASVATVATGASAKNDGKGKGKGKGSGKGKGNEDKGKGNGDQGQAKVTICHKGKTITVAEPAVPAHLAHGDTEGPCPYG